MKRVAIVAFFSNTSLCGAFNANVIKMLLQTVGEFRTLGQDNILIFPVGKKVDEAAKRLGFQPQETSATLSDKLFVSGGFRVGTSPHENVHRRRNRSGGADLSSLQINGVYRFCFMKLICLSTGHT